MGTGASALSDGVRGHLSSEFSRVMAMGNGVSDDAEEESEETASRDYIVLHEVLKIQPLESAPVDFTALPILWVLDHSKTGKITLADLMLFAERSLKCQLHGSQDFSSTVYAYCCKELAAATESATAREAFTEWFCLLTADAKPATSMEDGGDECFVSMDCVSHLNTLLRFNILEHIDAQELGDLLQRGGEDNGSMSLELEKFDDLVPVSLVKLVAQEYLAGFHDVTEKVQPAG